MDKKLIVVLTTRETTQPQLKTTSRLDATVSCPSGYQRFEEGARGKQGVASQC
jgi:hypothetical protein